jgi:membrane protein
MRVRIQHWVGEGEKLFKKLDEKSGGVLNILYSTVKNFNQNRGPEAAASIAYYFIFSFFPLILSVIAIGSFFLESERVQRQVLTFIRMVLPVGPGLIIDNLREVFRERTAFGITGAIGLMWGATAAFNTLFRNINRAWKQATPLNMFKTRMVTALVIVVLVLLLILVRYTSVFINVLPALAEALGEEGWLYETFLWLFLSNLVPLLITFFLFMIIYRWIPNTHVLWSEAFWGALIAAIGWELVTNIFTWVLGVGLIQYRLVYGSLGSMIALLFWVYINSYLILFGAHLSAAIARKQRPFSEDVQPDPGMEVPIDG